MDGHLELATRAYRDGLAEICRLVEDEGAPYGGGLRTAAAMSCVDSVALLVQESFSLGAEVDVDRLAWVLSQLDPATVVKAARGGSVGYLTGLLAKLFGRLEGTNEGTTQCGSGPHFGEWLQSVLLRAGYQSDVIESAWLNLLDMMVAVFKDSTGRFGEATIPIAASHLQRILKACPARVASELIDGELQLALSELGIRHAEMVAVCWSTADGDSQEVAVERNEYDKALRDDVVAVLAGRKPPPRDSLGITNIIEFPRPTSLVVRFTTVPSSRESSLALTDGTARAQLWPTYFGLPDPDCREAAWVRGSVVLESASQGQGGQHEGVSGDERARWESLRSRLLSEDAEVWRGAAEEAIAASCLSPTVLASSLVDASSFPGLGVDLLAWVTPVTVGGWLGLSPQAVECGLLPSSTFGTPVSSPLLHDGEGLRDLVWALSSPFGDGQARVRSLADELKSTAGIEAKRRAVEQLLDLALTTGSATVASNALAAVLDSGVATGSAAMDAELPGMLTRALGRAVWPIWAPAGDEHGSLALEYCLAEHLWISWTQHGEIGQAFESRAYLAIRGAALLAALASETGDPTEPGSQVRLADSLAVDPASLALAWHLEPDSHEFLAHPMRGRLHPWSALLLLGPLTSVPNSLTVGEEAPTALAALQVLGFMSLLNLGLSCTGQTRRSVLDEGFAENPVSMISELLQSCRAEPSPDPCEQGTSAATGNEDADPASDLLRQIAIAEPGIAGLLLSNGVTVGPIGYDAWVGRLGQVVESGAILERILDDRNLRGEWLLTLSLCTVAAATLGQEVPMALLAALLPPSAEDNTDPILRLTAVTSAVASGAELPGVYGCLFELLLLAVPDRAAAKACVLLVMTAASSSDATTRMREDLHDLLIRIGLVPPYIEMPELRRYRQSAAPV